MSYTRAMAKLIVMDNALELFGKAMFFKSEVSAVTHYCLQLNKPIQNTLVKYLNVHSRDSFVNQLLFQSLDDRRQLVGLSDSSCV